MDDKGSKSAMDLKRRMADRVLELTRELGTVNRQDLLLMRTSELEEFGKQLASVLKYVK